MHDSIIRQLEQRFNGHIAAHQIVVKRLTLDEWKQSANSFAWMLVETNDQHTVYLDTFYGWLALFNNGVLVGVGKETITSNDCVVLCKDYFGTPKYIWK